MTLDPGTCPVPTSDAELKSVRTFTYYYSSRHISRYCRSLKIWRPKDDLTDKPSASSAWWVCRVLFWAYRIISFQARKPLRSKHCRICGKCVARSDQYVVTTLCVLRTSV